MKPWTRFQTTISSLMATLYKRLCRFEDEINQVLRNYLWYQVQLMVFVFTFWFPIEIIKIRFREYIIRIPIDQKIFHVRPEILKFREDADDTAIDEGSVRMLVVEPNEVPRLDSQVRQFLDACWLRHQQPFRQEEERSGGIWSFFNLSGFQFSSFTYDSSRVLKQWLVSVFVAVWMTIFISVHSLTAPIEFAISVNAQWTVIASVILTVIGAFGVAKQVEVNRTGFIAQKQTSHEYCVMSIGSAVAGVAYALHVESMLLVLIMLMLIIPNWYKLLSIRKNSLYEWNFTLHATVIIGVLIVVCTCLDRFDYLFYGASLTFLYGMMSRFQRGLKFGFFDQEPLPIIVAFVDLTIQTAYSCQAANIREMCNVNQLFVNLWGMLLVLVVFSKLVFWLWKKERDRLKGTPEGQRILRKEILDVLWKYRQQQHKNES